MLDVPDVYARESEKAFTFKISLLEINCWNVWVRMTSCINFLSETIAASQCCCNHNGLETCAEKAKESSSQKTNWWVPSLLTWPFCFVPPLTSAWISTHRKLRIEKLECAVNLWCACAQCSGSINRTCFIFHGERINDFFFFFFKAVHHWLTKIWTNKGNLSTSLTMQNGKILFFSVLTILTSDSWIVTWHSDRLPVGRLNIDWCHQFATNFIPRPKKLWNWLTLFLTLSPRLPIFARKGVMDKNDTINHGSKVLSQPTMVMDKKNHCCGLQSLGPPVANLKNKIF